MDLCEYLIRERPIHNPRGMARRVTQINQAALRQQQQMIIGFGISHDLVHLRFDFFPLPFGAHIGGINFVVEVSDVADHSAGFQCPQHGGCAHIEIARCGHQHVGGA